MLHPRLTEYELLLVERLHFWYAVGVDNNCPTWYDFCLLLWPFLPLWSPSLTKIQIDPVLFLNTPNLCLPQDLCTCYFLSLEGFTPRFSHWLAPSHHSEICSNITSSKGESHRELGNRLVNLRVCVPEIKVLISGVTTVHFPHHSHIVCPVSMSSLPLAALLFPCLWCTTTLRWLSTCQGLSGSQHTKQSGATSEEWHFSPGTYPDTQTLIIIL